MMEQIFAVSFLEERGHLPSGTISLDEVRRYIQVEAPGMDVIDRILLERLTSVQTDVLTYLVECHTRAEAWEKETPSPLLAHIKHMVVSYAGLTLLGVTDFFDQPSDIRKQGAGRLVACIQRSLHVPATLPVPFLDQLAKRFHGMPVGEDLTTLLAPGLAHAVQYATPTDFLTCLRTGAASSLAGLLLHLAHRDRDPALVDAMVATPAWFGPVVPVTGVSLETQSLLGTLLRISPFPVGPPHSYAPGSNPVGEHLFPTPQDVTRDEFELAQSSVRTAVKGITSTALSVLDRLLRTTAKDATLDWIARVTDVNVQRTQLGHQAGVATASYTASNDGFLTHLAIVMLGLCERFMDPSSPLVNKIDASYVLSPACRMDVSKDTRIAATGEQIVRWCDRNHPARMQARRKARPESDDAVGEDVVIAESFGNVTEFFFLTARCLHVGPMALIARMDSLYQELREFQGQLDDLDRLRASAPASLQTRFQRQHDVIQQHVDRMIRAIHCYRTVLHDPAFNETLLRYARLVAVWSLRLVGYNFQSPGPLPVDAPLLFRALPEYLLENVGHILAHVLRTSPSVLESFAASDFDDLLTFMVAFLGADTYLTNPSIRAQYVEILAELVPSSDDSHHRGPTPGDAYPRLFETNALSCLQIVPYLMRFYVDVEFAGDHGYYHKWGSRHHITKVLAYLWHTGGEFRQAFHTESQSEHFVRFVNMIINDSTYCVDEALTGLESIHTISKQMASAEWARMSEEERQRKQTTRAQDTRRVRSHLQNADNVIGMLLFITSEIVVPFMRPELVDRIAAMLNDWLLHLVGPRATGLKVDDPEAYNFRPKELLVHVCNVYLHLAVSPVFASAVAHDGRSYRPETFVKAASILERRGLASVDDIDRFHAFAAAVREEASKATLQDEMLGEIPEEFLDPITSEMMKDPVILPSTGVRCDRSSITRHLLSDPTDPFNRSHLTVEMLVSDSPLKQQIEQFVSERRKGEPRHFGGHRPYTRNPHKCPHALNWCK